MKAEIVAIGSELLLGQIVDTNTPYIAKSLAENGIELVHTTTVGDHLHQMKETIKAAVARSQIIITTGGIGPTEDDLTREAIAQVTGHPLVFQPHLMDQIEALFEKRGFRMVENNRKQAYIPEGAVPIENPRGTAPGFIVEGPHWVTLSIPGVPSEMEYLMEHTVIPYLRRHFNLKQQVIRYRVLRACGLGESAIGLQIKDLMKQGQNPSVGTLASIGDIRIRITAKADNLDEASALIQEMEREVRNRLGTLIYGVDQETLHGNIVQMLERVDLRLSVLETFTGGIICQKLSSTDSIAFAQGMVLHSDESQRRFLSLSSEEFISKGKDLKSLTDLFARRIRDGLGTDIGLSVHDRILEKQGADEYRLLTCYALATPDGTEEQEHILGGEIPLLRERASIIALDTLRKYLLKVATDHGA